MIYLKPELILREMSFNEMLQEIKEEHIDCVYC